PEFNLRLARQLKQAGIPTVQYVSPQVWAWRQGRVRSIGAACDLVLCLLPFETEFYAAHGVRAEFVGHPLADEIPLQPDRGAARAALGPPAARTVIALAAGAALGLPAAGTVIALLPGSRLGEVSRLATPFIAAAARLAQLRPDWRYVAAMASAATRAAFATEIAQVPGAPAIQVLDGQAQRALAAADGVLVASGTATLE